MTKRLTTSDAKASTSLISRSKTTSRFGALLAISRRMFCLLTFACLFSGCDLFSSPPTREIAEGDPSQNNDIKSASLTILQSEHSCAAAACHGGIEPKTDSRIGRNEANVWKSVDPHINAYDALRGEEGQQMALLLNGPNGLPAHRDKRCLACHAPGLMSLAEDDPALEDGMTGLGCMACHGQSTDWVYAHVSWDYSNATQIAENYEKTGMTHVADEMTRTTMCISCHVGGVDNERWPHREVNHDLIAAGHPRMHFENLRFHDAMPPHWLPKDESPDEQDPLRMFAFGQVLAMNAWLELLIERIESLDDPASHSVWPEFSEHACFDCHHDLAHDSWRRGNPPDSIAPRWGNYYAELLPQQLLLVEGMPEQDRTTVANLLGQLSTAMHSYSPDQAEVLKLAEGIQLVLKPQLSALLAKPKEAQVQQFRQACKEYLSDAERLKRMRWEQAVQLYLALDTLTRDEKETALRKHVDELGATLQFDTAGKVVFESPRQFRFNSDVVKPLQSIHDAFPDPE